ncbi:MAG: PilZ domain-containing protein [Chitinispirillaceae bacterium]|nr:PilZ domain-containing protein [Chitinispirillaceae bacterium]
MILHNFHLGNTILIFFYPSRKSSTKSGFDYTFEVMETVAAGIKNLQKALFSAVLAGSSSAVFGESLIEQIGWEGATTSIIASVALILASLLLVMIILYVRMQLKIKHDREEMSNNLFYNHALKSDLYPSETKRLQQLLTHEVIPHPHTIFQSASLFERCIDAEVRLLLLMKNDSDLLEDDEKTLSGIRKKLGYGYLPLEHPLLSTRNVEVGQVMTVFKTTGSAPLVQHAVVVMNRETFFRLQYNIDNEDTVNFSSGQEVKLAFARQGDGVYGVQVGIRRIDSPSAIDCLHTLHLRRNQMRQYVRIEVNLSIRVRVVPPQEAAAPEPFALHVDAKLSDISGGGLSFLYEKPFVPGDIVSMQFSLTTGVFSGITGKVLRVSLQEGKSATWYRHHIQFLSIEQHNRDRIVKFIFEKQRQQSQIR